MPPAAYSICSFSSQLLDADHLRTTMVELRETKRVRFGFTLSPQRLNERECNRLSNTDDSGTWIRECQDQANDLIDELSDRPRRDLCRVPPLAARAGHEILNASDAGRRLALVEPLRVLSPEFEALRDRPMRELGTDSIGVDPWLLRIAADASITQAASSLDTSG
jgi:hypothetical protein